MRRYLLCGLAAAAVVAAMAIDTKVVKIGSGQDAQEQGFSASTYGEKTFPGNLMRWRLLSLPTR